MNGVGRKILFVVTEDWYFCSHRLPLAQAALAQGHDVAVVTQVTNHRQPIEDAGLRLLPLRFRRSGRNPLADLGTLISLWRIYRRERPDLVHHVSLKPVIYGSIAARLAGVDRVVNALTGLGYVFTSTDGFARLLRMLLSPLLGLALKRRGSITILQNADDRRTLVDEGLLAEGQAVIIRGSGVDTEQFRPGGHKGPVVQVVLASRLLRDKGVAEFAAAACRLMEQGVEARFILIGETDPENPAAIPVATLDTWRRAGIECWGRREDMAAILAGADIACLPSYREGLPKVLLEAASCALPIITTDAPGCREVVVDGVNGFLVPVRDVEQLTERLARLIADAELRRCMGAAGRARVERCFALPKVIDETLGLYECM